MKPITSIYILLTLTALAAIGGCSKEPAAIGDAPSIKFISISPNPAIKYQDEVDVTIKYTDGNADLGENTADKKNAFITDSRNNVTYQFRIPQQAPNDASIIITGQLTFRLAPQGFVDDNNTSETTKYSIRIVDRAGNESNTVETSTLTINK